jgi:SAM-dependent methyltransferase
MATWDESQHPPSSAWSLIDYDRVADIYDLYVSYDFDIGLYVAEAKNTRGKVLELMSGTGRVSIPLAEAGVDLTCVDVSEKMLTRLKKKLRERNLKAQVVRADVRKLDLREKFDLAIIPFNSFSELVSREDQELALKAIHGCLQEGARLICSLHDPMVRARTADGTLRLNGTFAADDGVVVVSGFESHDERTGVVDRTQFYEFFDASNNLRSKRLLPMRFALIEREGFQELTRAAGFRAVALYGDYNYGEYRAGSSPYMIWILERWSP